MRDEDDKFLERVRKEAPEALDATVDDELFNLLTKRLIEEIPAPKRKRINARQRIRTK